MTKTITNIAIAAGVFISAHIATNRNWNPDLESIFAGWLIMLGIISGSMWLFWKLMCYMESNVNPTNDLEIMRSWNNAKKVVIGVIGTVGAGILLVLGLM